MKTADAAQRLRMASQVWGRQDLAAAQQVIDACVDEAVLVAVSKPILMQYIESASQGDRMTPFAAAVAEYIFQKIRTRTSTFGDENVRLREVLTDEYEGGGRVQDAIRMLAGMPIEVGLRSFDDAYKVSMWVRIAEMALRMDDSVTADTYVTKAWPLTKNVKDATLKLRFSSCFASVLDSKRKFLDAAVRYYELSQALEDSLDALRRAIVCVVLADAGPQRARLLGTLFKDERIASLGPLHTILMKVYRSRILRPKDVQLLQPFLLEHQKALTKDNRTVVDHAIMQHNLLSASQLYYNISFAELGALLGIPSDQAEKVAAQMISEGRLRATIDQIDETIYFGHDAAAPIQQWDSQISAACNSVSHIADVICAKHPEFLECLK